MSLVKRALRPFYRLLVERPLWWFLSRVKAYFLAEVGVQIEQTGQRLAAIEERLRAMEANNAAQWDGLEQLLLAMFRQPEARARVGANWSHPAQQQEPKARAAGQRADG
jgi:hypothetical protein